METALFILLIIVIGISAFFIARKVWRSMQPHSPKWAVAIGILTFLFVFFVFLFVLTAIFNYSSEDSFGR